jgi:protein required for attachment to host cells
MRSMNRLSRPSMNATALRASLPSGSSRLIYEGVYKHLVIVAAPGFLGALREVMDRHVAHVVRAEVAKNVVKVEGPEALRSYLPDFIY